jgi:hypothetical protein
MQHYISIFMIIVVIVCILYSTHDSFVIHENFELLKICIRNLKVDVCGMGTLCRYVFLLLKLLA